MNASGLLPSSRGLHIMDIVTAAWVAAWIGLGIAIGIEMGHLADLSRTVTADSRAVQTVGSSLSALHDVPFIGGTIGRAASQIEQAGLGTAASARSTATNIRTLAILLAIAVALLPSVPVLGFYLPLRLNRRREAQAVRRALRRHGDDPAFEALLARRALASVGYRDLERLSTGWREPPDADRRRLAEAELGRLGINPARHQMPPPRAP
jgi:hypothetical protein